MPYIPKKLDNPRRILLLPKDEYIEFYRLSREYFYLIFYLDFSYMAVEFIKAYKWRLNKSYVFKIHLYIKIIIFKNLIS